MLTLEGVSAGYHRAPVILDMNLSFREGTLTAVIGPNGSGKSTLLKAIVDLCQVYQGRICLDGIYRDEAAAGVFAKRISYLSQNHSDGTITVSKMVLHGRFPHLSYPRRYRKQDYEACNAAMERMGILDLQHRQIGELSGGQRQKVYLAMALAGEMDVYLFDEPTTFLDVRHQLELLTMLCQLKRQKKTVVTVLHDLQAALNTADQIVVLEQGRVVFCGTPDQALKTDMISRVFRVKIKEIVDEAGKRYLWIESVKSDSKSAKYAD